MGGCASKPKDSEFRSEYRPPREVPPPPAPEMVEPENKPTTQEKTENEGEQERDRQVEEPLVDLSKPKNEAPILSSFAAPAAIATEAAVAKLKEEEIEEPRNEATDDKSMKEDKNDMAPFVQLM
ncbi:hypothetical protein SLE2022_374970 [Rubroshorea leprosula]